MRFMRMVHGDQIGDQIGAADKTREIRHRIVSARLNEKRGMGNIPQPHGIIRQRRAKTGMVQIFQPRRGIGKRNAMAWPAVLRRGGRGQHQDEQD